MARTDIAFVDAQGDSPFVAFTDQECQRCGAQMEYVFDDLVCVKCDWGAKGFRPRFGKRLGHGSPSAVTAFKKTH